MICGRLRWFVVFQCSLEKRSPFLPNMQNSELERAHRQDLQQFVQQCEDLLERLDKRNNALFNNSERSLFPQELDVGYFWLKRLALRLKKG